VTDDDLRLCGIEPIRAPGVLDTDQSVRRLKRELEASSERFEESWRSARRWRLPVVVWD
jgi:hypothetical protein